MFTLIGKFRFLPVGVVTPPPRCCSIVYFCTPIPTVLATGNVVVAVLDEAGDPNPQSARHIGYPGAMRALAIKAMAVIAWDFPIIEVGRTSSGVRSPAPT